MAKQFESQRRVTSYAIVDRRRHCMSTMWKVYTVRFFDYWRSLSFASTLIIGAAMNGITKRYKIETTVAP